MGLLEFCLYYPLSADEDTELTPSDTKALHYIFQTSNYPFHPRYDSVQLDRNLQATFMARFRLSQPHALEPAPQFFL